MQTWLTEQLKRISGRSILAQAIRHALNHWNGLILYLHDGRLELDTNTVGTPCCRGTGKMPKPQTHR
jgi:transposase